MAGNPRKFSEKIALHTQKQAEETAAFEQIMKEVTEVATRTSGGGPPTTPKAIKQPQQNLLPITSNMNCRSLPNVHAMSSHHDKGQQGGHFNPKMGSPRASRGNSIGPVKNHPRSRTDHSPYASPPSATMLTGSMTGGNSSGSNLYSSMMYQNSPSYLIPPSDGPWRRANSDSALHSLIIPSVVPDSSEESSNNSNDPRDNYGYGGLLGHSPKHNDSSSVIPNTVGDGPSLLEISSSVPSGSLPDLTSFQFTPPLQQPIDPEDSQLTNSPYSTSPLSLTYSPGGSPNPPPHSNNSQQQGINNQRSPHGHPHHQQQQQSQQQQSPHNQQNNQSQQQNILDNSINSAFQFTSAENNMLTAYRCPPRPSPQNSPSPFRSQSPLDGQLSGPSSPAAQPQMQNSAESFYLSQQANALQQHFEQISMGSPAPPRTSSNWQGGGMVNNSPYYYNTGQAQIQTGATAGITAQQSPQHHQPQTPQTPSSIPDIIFTDFDVRSSEPFDDLLATEAAAAQALREGLGSLDMDGFNMLADPDLVPLDPSAEDSFRLDRL
ncbi:CREB-regulated transcription coactivator 1 isoform X2 [Folsomia candida]|uniref:CREB-regulated transcription coactivator 1 isoform X2 n=1 Tax=Folsomia candida TaxID=158441 RepID=UPI000B8F9D79|nr:CREB-regulated transcription coactivator 1 isoform X2 [Folsomia candida]